MSNPAQLLHQHISRLNATRSESMRVRDAMARIFGVAPDDYVAQRKVLLLLDAMFAATEARLNRLRLANPGPYLRYFPQLRAGLATLHLDNPTGTAFNFITEAAIENLSMSATRLAEFFPPSDPTVDELDELRRRIEDFALYVEQAEIDPPLRDLTNELVASLRAAVVEYQIRGIEGLQAALEQILGKLLLYKGRNGDVPKDIWDHIWSILVVVEGAVSRALTYGPVLVKLWQLSLGP